MKLEVESIGTGRALRDEARDDFWGGSAACTEADARFEPNAVDGSETLSRVEVLFFFDCVDPAKIVSGTRQQRNNLDWPAVGIFAQRSKNRPSQLESTLCRVVRRDGRNFYVSELDAVEGTPVVDIKPVALEFLPRGEVRQPDRLGDACARTGCPRTRLCGM